MHEFHLFITNNEKRKKIVPRFNFFARAIETFSSVAKKKSVLIIQI